MRCVQVCYVAFCLLAGQVVMAQEPARDVKSAMAELDRFVGDWEKQMTVYKSAWSPEEQTKTGTQTDSWILGKNHLQESGRDSDGLEYLTIYSYDAAAKTYKASVYQSSGNSWEMQGKWDAKASTLTLSHEVADGVQMVATYKFVTSDRFNFSFVAKDQGNEIVFNLKGTANRKFAAKK